jgi:archaellum component FlaF (FlaF/FlaG flagellin family)
MLYRNIRLRRKNKKKIQIISRKKFGTGFWIAILVMAVFLNVQETLASEITSEKLIKLVNELRAEQRIGELIVNPNLTLAAANKARDMFEHNYFAHTSPQGITPWHWIRQADYSYQYAGENLAMDFITAEGMHKALIASATHRKNILNPNYKEIGIAVLDGNFEDRQTIIAVQIFGTIVSTIEKQKIAENSTEPSVSNKPITIPVSTITKIIKPTAMTLGNHSNKNKLNKKKLVLSSDLRKGSDSNSQKVQQKAPVLPVELVKEDELIKEELVSDEKENNFIFKEKNLTIPFLKLDSNGRIKGVSENTNKFVILNLPAALTTLQTNLFQDLFQNFDYRIDRFRNYLSCFLFGGSIEAYIR